MTKKPFIQQIHKLLENTRTNRQTRTFLRAAKREWRPWRGAWTAENMRSCRQCSSSCWRYGPEDSRQARKYTSPYTSRNDLEREHEIEREGEG